ncbi:MAG: dTDP-4-dehydrorhamnose reductase [Firmicutes bacterium]|nr:dTDP-4-dehydrorhamnose reductase [Bacillota bacterium]
MTKNSIWITGASGRLGNVLKSVLKNNVDYRVIPTDEEVDVSSLEDVQAHADLYRPNIIINCAALSNEEYCETHKAQAYKVNAIGARNLAIVSRKLNAKIIQISTDDVFNGAGENVWNEFDQPSPISVYGKSKLAGEQFVRELNPKHLIIRSSWVYGKGKSDYFSFVEEKGKNGESFEAVVNEISSPTNSKTLAKFIVSMLNSNEYGIYHASCEGKCSRFEYAQAILSNLGYDPTLVKAVVDTEGKNNSALLDNLMMEIMENYTMPHWKDDLNDYIANLKGGKK